MTQANHIALTPHMIKQVVGAIFSFPILHVETATGGISTTVYRLYADHGIFYLRLLPDVRDSFAGEYQVHRKLREMGLKVPEVVHFEEYNDVLQQSVMITTEVRGVPVMQAGFVGEERLREIVREAGREIALMNSVPVRGIGRLRHMKELENVFGVGVGAQPTTNNGWDVAVDYLCDHVFSVQEGERFREVISRHQAVIDNEQSCLAHGDFSVRHIFQENGKYTGIIDFGDSLGANQWYDLGHFHMRDLMRDDETFPYKLEADLLRGYEEVVPLPEGYEQGMRMMSIRFAVPMLVRGWQRDAADPANQALLGVLLQDMAAL